MALYAALADLPLTIDGFSLDFRERHCAGDFARASVILGTQEAAPDDATFVRPSTRITLVGDGAVGRGEDVTYDVADHRAFLEAADGIDLEGTYTVDTFSEALGGIDLFPSGEPVRQASRSYRRWAVESAALDLALKQADTDLAAALGRRYEPVRFLVSTRLGEPPAADRVDRWLEIDPDLEFKLDATSSWSAAITEALAATDAVRIVDLKGQYRGTMVDQSPDPDLYRGILAAFSDAVIEDPVLTDGTRPLFEGQEGRISWDAPITDVASIEGLPFAPRWINIKPSRSGSVETLFAIIEYCLANGIRMYGGGQTELSVGRQHIHAFASLFYPDGPNDTAPRRYNDPEPVDGLPPSPLAPPTDPTGFEW